MEYDDVVEVECDGCGAILGVCSEEEYDRFNKDLLLCSTCDHTCCGPDRLREVGMLDYAAQVERQWKIERSLCDYGEVLEGRQEGDGVPF